MSTLSNPTPHPTTHHTLILERSWLCHEERPLTAAKYKLTNSDRSANPKKTPYRRQRASTCPQRLRYCLILGPLQLHPLRQGVLGPEPHAPMRGICLPVQRGRTYSPHLGWAHRQSDAARSRPRVTRDAGGFTTWPMTRDILGLIVSSIW